MSECKIAQILFCTQIVMLLSCIQMPELEDFKSILTNTQKEKFKKIQRTRLLVYLYGGMLGAIIAKFIRNDFCGQALIIIGVQTIFYVSYPWLDYMADHIDTPQQINAWAKVNKKLTRVYSYALAIGGLSSIASIYIL